MKLNRREFVSACAALCGATSGARLAWGEGAYPAHAVRIIVPASPGGVLDVTARLVAPRLSQRLGQQFYVENIAGGASNIGTIQAARAQPDGHTLLCTASVFVINAALHDKSPYAPEHDFQPVSLLCTTPVVLTVNPNVPARRLDELAALIRKNPGFFSFASPGVGTPPHLVGEMFRMSLGVDLAHVPYKSGGEALAATMSGHTQLCFGALGVAAPQIKAGTVRAIAIASARRSPTLPGVSTMQEAGYPDIAGEVWAGLLAPAQTPREVVAALYKEIKFILAEPDVTEHFAALGFDIVGSAPDEFRDQISAELKRWKKVVQAAGIKRS